VALLFRKAAKIFGLAILTLSIVSWLFLYVDSVYHRRQAERLIAELQSFPFSSARFLETRDFVNRFGGKPLVQFPDVRLSAPGLPVTDEEGGVHLPAIDKYPRCDAENCVFQIWLKPKNFVLATKKDSFWFSTLLANMGLRPWAAATSFEIVGGYLKKATFSVVQTKIADIDGKGLAVQLGYVAVIEEKMTFNGERNELTVFAPKISFSTDALYAMADLNSREAIRRSMDIRIACVSAVFRPCKGFSELAPSGWAEYSKRNTLQH